MPYLSSPVGVHPKPENCVFVPIPVELRFHDAERSGCTIFLLLFYLNANSLSVDLLTSAAASPSSSVSHPVTDLQVLEDAIQNVSSMLDRVLVYVRSVLSGQVKGDQAVGRYLMDTLGASTAELEKGSFSAGLQVRFL